MKKFVDIVRENEEDDDALMTREENIQKLIHYAFDRIGLPIETDGFGVIYDEDNDREAIVTIKDNVYGYSTKQLSHLEKTGLSDEYLVRPGTQNELEIVFKVKEELDQANLS